MVAAVALLWLFFMWCVVAAIVSIPTWMLWNWLMPVILGLPEITLLQAFGLLLLTSCFFGARPTLSADS